MAALALLLFCAAAVVVVHAELDSAAVDSANAGAVSVGVETAFHVLERPFPVSDSSIFFLLSSCSLLTKQL